jgi:hypothetical protein
MKALPEIIGAFTRGIGRSRVSLFGAMIVTVTTPFLFGAIIYDVLFHIDNTYIAGAIYMLLGPAFIGGLILVFLGLFFFKGKEEVRLFTLDYLKGYFTDPEKFSRMRKLVFFAVFLTGINVLIVSLLGYRTYHYMESVAFCGEFCHTVMNPERTAYLNSPHSRVTCVECHIGAGADWFVKSKISGARQLFAVALDTYPRPIETPVHGLRPARDTCEECHRPEMFHGDKLVVKDKFLEDESNTHVKTVLLMKIGSAGDRASSSHGIHWHVAPENKIFYKPSDHSRMKIPEVIQATTNGNILVYRSSAATAELQAAGKIGLTSQRGEDPVAALRPTPAKSHPASRPGTGELVVGAGGKTASSPAPNQNISALIQAGGEAYGEFREMDCIDCHNRPTHIYLPPGVALDNKIMSGAIDKSIPFIKKKAMEVISRDYLSQEEAKATIAAELHDYYAKNYSGVVDAQGDALRKSIAGIQAAYAENVFPEMNIKWGTYTNHLGHNDDVGCFRCHDEDHQTEAGEVISMDCNTCHTILAEDEQDPEILRTLSGN